MVARISHFPVSAFSVTCSCLLLDSSPAPPPFIPASKPILSRQVHQQVVTPGFRSGSAVPAPMPLLGLGFHCASCTVLARSTSRDQAFSLHIPNNCSPSESPPGPWLFASQILSPFHCNPPEQDFTVFTILAPVARLKPKLVVSFGWSYLACPSRHSILCRGSFYPSYSLDKGYLRSWLPL